MPDINVEAQGKTFTFPDGTSQQQIGEAVDSFFKGKASSKPSFDYEKGNYIPSEGIGSSGMRSKGTASQQALMTPKAAFSPTSEQRAKLGPMGNGVSQQPLPQGVGYDVARAVLSFMKNEPGATLAKGYYESDPGSYERLLTDKGFMAKAKRTAIGSMEPNQALPLMAGGGILSILPKKAAALGLGAIAANQGREAYHSYQDDDPGGALFDLLLGAAAGLGAKKMLKTPAVPPVPYRSPITEGLIRSAERESAAREAAGQDFQNMSAADNLADLRADANSTATRGQRLISGPLKPPKPQASSPTARSGKNVRGLLPAAPEGTPQTSVEATAVRPMPGEHPTPYGSEPLTFQQFIDEVQSRNPAKPTTQGEPSQASGAQPFQVEPNFRPDDTAMSFQDWLDTFQGKGPLSAKQPFTTNQAGVTAKPGESAIQKALTAVEETPAAPPTKKGGGVRKKMGNQTGAFDTSILRDAMDKARDLFDEGASFTNRLAPLAVQKLREYDNAKNVTEASVDKIISTLEPLGDKKDLFQRMVTADKQIQRGVSPSIPEADVKRFFNIPVVKSVLPKYNQAVKDVYGPLRTGAGYGQSDLLGKYSGAWTPSVAESHIQNSVDYPSAPGSKPVFVPNKVQGEQQFTGTGQYHPELEFSHNYRLSGLTRASGQRQVLSALKDANVLQDMPTTYTGKMTVNGQELDAMPVSLTTDFGLRPNDLQRVGLPDRVMLPRKVAAEIKPVFEKSMKPYEEGKIGAGFANVMKAYLYSTGELGAHAVTLPSIAGASTKLGKTGLPPLDYLLNSIGPIRNLARMKDMVRATKFSNEEIADARILAAKAGIYRENPLAKTSGMSKAKAILSSPGSAALYGRRGLFNNVVTGMVKVMKANGASESDITAALANLPSRKGTLVPFMQQAVERVMGPGFYSTGKAALKAGYKSFTPRNIIGALTFYTVLSKQLDEDGKYWWERGLMPGEFIRGTDKSGKKMKWDIATLDRMFRVQREIPGKTFQEAQVDIPNETPKQKAMRVGETGAYAAANQLTRPFFSGPTAALGTAVTGIAPYAVKSSDYTGPTALHTPISNLPFDHPDRFKALLEAMLPGSQAMMGDVNLDYKRNAPQSEEYANINHILRMIGQMPGKTWSERDKRNSAILTEYGNKSGTIKGRKRAALQAEGQARARR